MRIFLYKLRITEHADDGQRVQEAAPQGRWQIRIMLAALTTRGLEAPMIIAEPTSSDIFLVYLEQIFVFLAAARPNCKCDELTTNFPSTVS